MKRRPDAPDSGLLGDTLPEPVAAGPSDTSLVGTRVGNLRIEELLGSGGMGEVYRAADEVLRREVAVKTIHSHRRLDEESRARFLREARILSRLEHPNICRVHDYVSGENADLLVLELVRGHSLADEVRRGLGHTKKIDLAEQLLDALIAAHDEEIVHRDLKPANLMVTPTGRLKVLDFGIARTSSAADEISRSSGPDPAPGQRGLSSTVELTAMGTVMGTMAYMSPEQAGGEDITAASDIFSCGLVLQELFTERPARDLDRPTTLLLRDAMDGISLPTRGLDADLASLLERMKARAPGARPSARDAKERLAWIRAKPRRRLRRLAAAAGIVLLAGLAAVMSYQAWRIGNEAARANREAATAHEVSTFLEEMFAVADPDESRGRSLTAAEILAQGTERLRTELQDQPETRARLLHIIGRVHRQLGLYPESRALLEEASQLRAAELGSDSLPVAEILEDLGRVYELQAEYGLAEEILERVVSVRELNLGPDHLELARSLNQLANVLYQQARYDEARKIFQRSIRIALLNLGPSHPDLARPLNNLANVELRQGRFEDAFTHYDHARRILEENLEPDHPMLGHPLNNAGMALARLGRLDEAIERFEQALAIWEAALGPEHPYVAHPLNNLGNAYRDQDRFDLAERYYERALAIRRTALGPEHPDTALTLDDQATCARRAGDVGRAIAGYEEALEIRLAALDADHPDVATTLDGLGRALLADGRIEDAVAQLTRALEIRETRLDADHPDLEATRVALADAHSRL